MGKPVLLTAQEWMTDRKRQERANAIGRIPLYHLQYARKYKDNPILNPHLKGDRNATECQIKADSRRVYRAAKNSKLKRRNFTGAVGPVLSESHSRRNQGSTEEHKEDSGT